MQGAGRFDVVVVGAGNAALCAAISARDGGAEVLMVEKAPEDERGGNSLFTAGGFRFVHDGIEDLRKDVLEDLSGGRSQSDRHPNAAMEGRPI